MVEFSADWSRLLSIARQEVKATLRALPEELRSQVAQIPVTLEPCPSPELVADNVEADTLGLFVGGAFPDSEAGGAPLPAQVILFLENIWDFAEGDEAAYREEIRTTLLHELGHYLGLDEIDLEDRGLD